MLQALWPVILAIILYLILKLGIVGVWNVSQPWWHVSAYAIVVFAFAITVIVWSKREFDRLQSVVASLLTSHKNTQVVVRWYGMSIKRMYSPRNSAIVALAFFPIILLVMFYVDFNSWQTNRILYWYDTVAIALMFSAAGASQWPFASISDFMSKLSKKRLKINFYSHPREGIMAFGSFLLKIDLAGIFLVFLVGAAAYSFPLAVPIWLYGLILLIFVWAVIWFFLTQHSLHEAMVKQKLAKLSVVSRSLNQALEEFVKSPGEKTEKDYKSLKEVYDEVGAWPEWPFSQRNVATLLGGVGFPIAFNLLNLVQEYTGR